MPVEPDIEQSALTAGCTLQFQSVLIVTYGRSGSTLLQGLLNSVPGCLVRGENHNFCYHLFRAYRAIARAREENPREQAKSVTNPWYGAPLLDPDSFLRDAYRLVRRQLLGNADPARVRCLGFKEIRYPDVRELPEYLDFLARLFPRPAFLVLTRELESVLSSGWWVTTRHDVTRERLERMEREVVKWSYNNPSVFHIDYAALAGHGSRVRELFEFLGAAYDKASVDAVLATPHSYPTQESSSVASAAPLPRPKAVAGAWLEVELFDKAELPVRIVFFDPTPEKPRAGELVSIGGVVLVGGDASSEMSLELRSASQATAIEWMLPSPGIAGRFPGDPRAAQSRFRFPAGPDFVSSELFLCAPDGKTWPLARLRVLAN